MKKTLLLSLITSFGLILSSSSNANETEYENGYLNSNNLVSSFVSDVSNRVYREISEEEKLHLLEIQYLLNEQLIKTGITQNIHFRTNKYELDEPVYNYLSNLVLSLNNHEKLEYELNGYADYRGDSEYNLNLSKNRVQSVKNILINLGVNANNITESYFGDSKSYEQNDSEKYFYDRRVEFKINLKK